MAYGAGLKLRWRPISPEGSNPSAMPCRGSHPSMTVRPLTAIQAFPARIRQGCLPPPRDPSAGARPALAHRSGWSVPRIRGLHPELCSARTQIAR